MGHPPEKGVRRFTYAEYCTWDNGQRWELIDGVPYNMTPAPATRHQRILGNLHLRVSSFPAEKTCVPFLAPTDVVFDEYNVVRPDLLVVCDRGKITEANIQGAPDLVVEILSPSTSRKDRREKKALYERFGVREYIVIDPANRGAVQAHQGEIRQRRRVRLGRNHGPGGFSGACAELLGNIREGEGGVG